MLSNTLTLDDEEAVQEELLALQKDIVRVSIQPVTVATTHGTFQAESERPLEVQLPPVPSTQPQPQRHETDQGIELDLGYGAYVNPSSSRTGFGAKGESTHGCLTAFLEPHSM